jgi:hypothetical protein
MDQNSAKYPDHMQKKEGELWRGCTPKTARRLINLASAEVQEFISVRQ